MSGHVKGGQVFFPLIPLFAIIAIVVSFIFPICLTRKLWACVEKRKIGDRRRLSDNENAHVVAEYYDDYTDYKLSPVDLIYRFDDFDQSQVSAILEKMDEAQGKKAMKEFLTAKAFFDGGRKFIEKDLKLQRQRKRAWMVYRRRNSEGSNSNSSIEEDSVAIDLECKLSPDDLVHYLDDLSTGQISTILGVIDERNARSATNNLQSTSVSNAQFQNDRNGNSLITVAEIYVQHQD